MTQAMNPSAQYLAQLRQNLVESFNKDELRTLCFDLGIEHEDLPETKNGMARELVAYCKRTGHVPELVRKCKESRSEVVWEDLPATPPQAPSPPSATILITILIIDDEADWRVTWRSAMRGEGYRVEFATTYDEAIDKLEEMSFDLVITNLLLRDSFSPGWLKEPKRILDLIAGQEKTKVIIATGTNDEDSEVMYILLDLQQKYPKIRRILFKRRCTTPELRKIVQQVLMGQP